MWNWLGKVVEPVVGGISKFATEKNEIKKAKLDGDIEIAKAKAEFKVAQFKAKAAREVTTDKGTFDLDKMAVAEAAKTWWDGIFSINLFESFVIHNFLRFIQRIDFRHGWISRPIGVME